MSSTPWDYWVLVNGVASAIVILFYQFTKFTGNTQEIDPADGSRIVLIFTAQVNIYVFGQLCYALLRGPPAKPHWLGRLPIIATNIISLCAVVALRQFVENIWYSFAVIAFTMQLHAMRQILWLSCDYGFPDVFWVASLQISLAIIRQHGLRVCMLLLCVVLDYYRYSFYPRPTTTLNRTSKILPNMASNARNAR